MLASVSMGQEESVSNVAKARLDVSFVGQSKVESADEDLCPFWPFLSCRHYARDCSQDSDEDDPFYTPLSECLDSGNGSATSRDNRIDDDRKLGDGGLRLRQVIVVLDWLQ